MKNPAKSSARRLPAPDQSGSNPQEEESGPVGTLARGLAILDIVVDSPQPLTLAEIAAEAGLDQSTTFRLLRTLEENSYVVRVLGQKRYLPSPRAIRPLPLLHPIEQFRRDTASIVSDLADTVGQTVVLALFVGLERLVVDIAQRPGSLSPYYDNWLKGPLYATGVGKALLVNLDSASRRSILPPEPFPQYTPHTIVEMSRLEADLEVAAKRGFVSTHNEYRMGLTAVGADITTWGGNSIGCLVVTGHSNKIEGERLEETGQAVRRAAQLIPLQANSMRLVEQLSDVKSLPRSISK